MRMSVLFLVVVAVLISPAYAVEFGGVNVPDTLQAGQESLLLNGMGLRQKLFMDLYVGALYLHAKSHDAQAILDADAPMAITINIISSMITEERMAEATNEGFRSTTGGNTKPFEGDIEKFIEAFSKGIKKGDCYQLIYVPAKGVTVVKNGSEVLTIQGLEFKKVLYGIWIGKKATVNKSLQDGMLGNSK